MKLLLLMSATLLVLNANSQKLKEYTAKNGITYHVNDTVRLGRGSATNGEFLYLQLSGWAGALGYDQNKGPDQNNIGRRYANTAVIIKSIKTYKVKGIAKVFFMVGGGNISNYSLTIDDAIDVCEVKPCPNLKEEKSTISVADELTKLKKLYDDGVLTKEEYESQKKKLLGN